MSLEQLKSKYGKDLKSTTELGGVQLTKPLYYWETIALVHYIGFEDIPIGINRPPKEDFAEVLKMILKKAPQYIRDLFPVMTDPKVCTRRFLELENGSIAPMLEDDKSIRGYRVGEFTDNHSDDDEVRCFDSDGQPIPVIRDLIGRPNGGYTLRDEVDQTKSVVLGTDDKTNLIEVEEEDV
jgi:hypothetical protein